MNSSVSNPAVKELCAHRFSIAPMMELTDRHYRFLARLMTSHALLFSEMVTAKAILHGDKDYLLGFNEGENPIVLQLGGSDPDELAAAAVVGQNYGYDEINLNVGCPSDRVKSGRFGACLMAEAELVGRCVAAMQNKVSVPVTVKCRIGIDRDDAYEPFAHFVKTVEKFGCTRFYVHARKAWLDGLSPRENRDIPPLRYDYVQRIKNENPHLEIAINGGLKELDIMGEQLDAGLDGVMVGREAYYNPSMLMQVDQLFYGAEKSSMTCSSVARKYADYMERGFQRGIPMTAMSRHVVALYQGVPGARAWRRHLSSHASRSDSALQLVEEALEYVLSPPIQTLGAAR